MSPILEILSPIVKTLSADAEMLSSIGEILSLIWEILPPNYGENSTISRTRRIPASIPTSAESVFTIGCSISRMGDTCTVSTFWDTP